MPQFLPAHLAVLCGILVDGFRALSRGSGWRVRELSRWDCWRWRWRSACRLLWGAQLNRFSPMLDFAGRVLQPAHRLGASLVDRRCVRRIEEHCAFIAVVGVILVIAWLWRLCHLNEEMDDYQNMYQADAGPPHRLRGGRTAPHRGDAVGRNRLLARSATGGTTASAATTAAAKPAWFASCATALARIPIEVQGLFMATMIIAVGCS